MATTDPLAEAIAYLREVNRGTVRADRVELLVAEIERLRLALADALEGMEDMIPYVSEYFREKWGHDAYIERARAALAQPGP